MSDKTCRRCSQVLPLTLFPKDRTTSDGYYSYCKKCKGECAKTHKGDQAKARERRQRWAEKNVERFKEIQRADCRTRYARRKHDPVFLAANAARQRALRAKDLEGYNERQRARYAANREKRQLEKLRQAYGLSPTDYGQMVDAQQGLCAICGGPPVGKHGKLHVDHSHSTGRIRALLCQLCNTGLGAFKDDPERLAKALEYLKVHA